MNEVVIVAACRTPIGRLERLKPSFKEGGTVMAKILSTATTGVDPEFMGI
jgi:acetyl-CoA acetyltransferase